MGGPGFPSAAIVGREDMKLAMLAAAVDQGIGGVLAFGDRGTGKSTTVQALVAEAYRSFSGAKSGNYSFSGAWAPCA
jgi:hypothetical protein